MLKSHERLWIDRLVGKVSSTRWGRSRQRTANKSSGWSPKCWWRGSCSLAARFGQLSGVRCRPDLPFELPGVSIKMSRRQPFRALSEREII